MLYLVMLVKLDKAITADSEHVFVFRISNYGRSNFPKGDGTFFEGNPVSLYSKSSQQSGCFCCYSLTFVFGDNKSSMNGFLLSYLQCAFVFLLMPSVKGDTFVKKFVPQVNLFKDSCKDWFAYIKAFLSKFLKFNLADKHLFFSVLTTILTHGAEFRKAAFLRPPNHAYHETEPESSFPEAKLIKIQGFVHVTKPTGIVFSEQLHGWLNIGRNTCKFWKNAAGHFRLQGSYPFDMSSEFTGSILSVPYQFLLKANAPHSRFTSFFGWKFALAHNLSLNVSFAELYIPVRTCEQGSLRISNYQKRKSVFCGHQSLFNFYPSFRNAHINITKGRFAAQSYFHTISSGQKFAVTFSCVFQVSDSFLFGSPPEHKSISFIFFCCGAQVLPNIIEECPKS